MKYLSSLAGLALVVGAALPITTLAANAQVNINGVVTATAGNILTVKANNGGVYTIDIDDAKFKTRSGAKMTAGEVQVNDQIHVKGKIEGNTIEAKSVQDLSLQVRNAAFAGKVIAVGTSSFSLQSNNRGAQTVLVTASTTIKKNGEPARFADIVNGAMVRVAGVWDRANNVVTAKTVNLLATLRKIHVNGTITAKTDATLTVRGENNTTYTVDASNALIVRRQLGRAGLGEIGVGDKINVWAKHENSSTTLTAYLIHDFAR